MRFEEIPQLIRSGGYAINVSWTYVEEWITSHTKDLYKLELDPLFQRAHVWTEDQQRAYVEFKLRGGLGSDVILWNCEGWMRDFKGPLMLVDGKQRLEAVRKFLRDGLTVFDGSRCSEMGRLSSIRPDFVFSINNLPGKRLVLQWYLELNSGGTPHTTAELDRVRKMLGDLDQEPVTG